MHNLQSKFTLKLNSPHKVQNWRKLSATSIIIHVKTNDVKLYNYNPTMHTMTLWKQELHPKYLKSLLEQKKKCEIENSCTNMTKRPNPSGSIGLNAWI
jgi:hypothetical protein